MTLASVVSTGEEVNVRLEHEDVHVMEEWPPGPVGNVKAWNQ